MTRCKAGRQCPLLDLQARAVLQNADAQRTHGSCEAELGAETLGLVTQQVRQLSAVRGLSLRQADAIGKRNLLVEAGLDRMAGRAVESAEADALGRAAAQGKVAQR